VHPDVERAIREAAELLESLGHSVEEAGPRADAEPFVEHFVRMWIGGTGDELHTLEQLLGKPLDRDRIEPLTRQMEEISNSITATDYLVSLDYLRRTSREVVSFWEGYDVLVVPTLAKPPIEVGALDPSGEQEAVQRLMNSADWVPFTPIFNVTGQPAMSLPLGQSQDGLPIGVQFVGAPAAEEMLISLAAQLEQARPWADRRPPVAA
jgi:amidase